MALSEGFDKKNVDAWEEQMKNMQAPIGGDASASQEEPKPPQESSRFGFMTSEVTDWEKRVEMAAAPIGGDCGCGDKESSDEEEGENQEVCGFMGADVDTWERARSNIGATVEVAAEIAPEGPKMVERGFSFMTGDVEAWEEQNIKN